MLLRAAARTVMVAAVASGIDDLFYTTTPAGSRSCEAPATAPAAYDGESLVVMTGVTPDLVHFRMFSNFLFGLKLHGYGAPLRIALPEPDPNVAEKDYWKHRSRLVIHRLRTLPPDAVVLLVDGTDVLVDGPPDAVLDGYRRVAARSGRRAVFGAELLCDTASCRKDAALKAWVAANAPPGNAYAFLNAGNCVGEAAALALVFEAALELMIEFGEDDQTAIVRAWRETPGLLALDYDSEIFGIPPPWGALYEQHWAVDDDAVPFSPASRAKTGTRSRADASP